MGQFENKSGIFARQRDPGTIARLRDRIRLLECGGRSALPVLPLGLPVLDRHLPGGGLPLVGLHEVEGERAEWDDGVATGFALALLARLMAARPGPVLWVAPRLDLYGPGLADLGLDPGRLILARAGNDRDVLWALEDALRSGTLAAVAGEVCELERTAGRRLQLAAEAGGGSCFLLHRRILARRRQVAPSAALTRWRVAPLSSQAVEPGLGLALPGRARWQVELLRCRGAAPGRFALEWDGATGGFALAAALRDGPLAARPGAPEPVRLAG